MRSVPAVLVVLSLAAPAAAQDQVLPQSERRDPARGESTALDVERLPINLSRIQRELKQSKDVVERDGMNLRYTIQIYGSAPPLKIFNEDANLVNGPVPYGAPTHQEIINQITPIEYRAPFADFSALFRWLADRKKK